MTKYQRCRSLMKHIWLFELIIIAY